MSRRLIDSRLLHSKKWNSLSSHFTRLLYLSLLVSSDPYGYGEADAEDLKSEMFSGKGFSERESDIEQSLIELSKTGLIVYYETSGKAYYQITRFEDFQCFNKNNRKSASVFPSTETGTVRHSAAQCGTVPHCDVFKNINKTKSKTELKDNLKEKPLLYEIEHLELAEHLKIRIQENNSMITISDKQIKQWANIVRLMIKSDKRKSEDIRQVINWCQQDTFWMGNILSMGKLREKWDMLTARMSAEKIKNHVPEDDLPWIQSPRPPKDEGVL